MRMKIRGRSIVLDDAGFKESDHPRAPDGKFTSGAAGGKAIQSGVTFPKAGSLSNKIWHMAHDLSKKNGKAPTAKELNAYASSHGLEINPATASTQLNNYKKWVSNKEVEEQKNEKTPNTPATMNTVASMTGFKKEYSNEKITYYEKGDCKVSYIGATGSWQLKKGGELKAKGDDMDDLLSAMHKYAPEPEKPKVTPKPAPIKTKEPVPTVPDPHSVETAPRYASVIPSSSFNYTEYGIPDASGFPAGIKESLKNYTGSNYMKINSAMRFESDYNNVTQKVMRDILHIQKSFQIVPPTTEDCVVGRKVGLDALKTMAKSAGLNHLSELQPGTIIQEDGIVSTSHSEHVWSGDVRFSVKIPKGAKAINVQGISHNSSEQETLLPPGTRFKINKVSQNTGKHAYHLEVEVML